MIKLFEKFESVGDVKDALFIKAIETDELDLVKFFFKKGYNLNSDDAVYTSTFNDNIFRFFLKNKADVKVLNYNSNTREQLDKLEVQKALIDFGYDSFIYDTVGFNRNLKFDPKYADIIKRSNVWHIAMIESEKKGGGTELVNQIIADARKEGVEKITLNTTLHSGYGFFYKLGFKVIGDDRDPFDIPMELYLK